MKHIYAFALFLVMLTGIAFNSTADLIVKLEWDIPGSVMIKTGGVTDDFIELPADATSYTFETTSTFGYVYAFAAPGYALTGATTVDTDGNQKTYNVNASDSYGRWLIGSVNSMVNGSTIHVDCIKEERNDSFTVDVQNGLGFFTATFASGYVPDLKEGSHSYSFNPELDNPLNIRLNGVEKAYSISLDGVEIEKREYYPEYNNIVVPDNGVLKIRIFENEEDVPGQRKLSFDFPAEMEGCILNVYDRTSSRFLDVEDNSVTLLANSTVRVNFVTDDFNFSTFRLNETDITSSYSSGSVTFTMPDENSVLEIEGSRRVYQDVVFTGYIMNAEGLELRLKDSTETLKLPEGQSVSSDIKLGSLTMPAADTRRYEIPVPGKLNQFFFSPKEGYFIRTVYVESDGKPEIQSGSSSIHGLYDGTTFYMILEKMSEYTADLNITGDEFHIMMTSDNPIVGIWGNPSSPAYDTSAGSREITFNPDYNTPISISFFGGDEDMEGAVYLDGAAVTPVRNDESGANVYTVQPYFPTGDDSSGLKSVIDIYNSANERPKLSGASLELMDGARADFFYSPLLHVANPEGQVVISGTQFTVRPVTPNVTVTYKNQSVELDENGEFVFSATGNARNNVVRISPEATGVNAIASDNNVVTVISIDGRVILSNQPASRLNDLDNGLYIINGKKVVVKK